MSIPERRVIVFLDAQNIYERFKETFPPRGTFRSSTDGQFDPMALGTLLVSRAPGGEKWILVAVRAYVGRPNAVLEPVAAAAHTRQMGRWKTSGVVVRPRDLQYVDWPAKPPRQKGVDVELANDLYRMADDDYDIGILLSFDTDMVPAIEAIYEKRGTGDTPRICVVGLEGLQRRLRLGDTRAPRLYCFYLSQADYAGLHDPTDYRVPPSSP